MATTDPYYADGYIASGYFAEALVSGQAGAVAVGKYDPQARMALSMLTRKGTTISLRRTDVGSADPVTQVGLSGSSTTYSFIGIGFPPGRSAQYKAATLEKKALLEVYLALKNAATIPEPGDVLTFSDTEFTVFWVETINPDGAQPVFSRCYCE